MKNQELQSIIEKIESLIDTKGGDVAIEELFSGFTAEAFDSILRSNLTNLNTNHDEKDARWCFIEQSIRVLVELRNILDQHKDDKDFLLSVKQQKQISALFSLIIALGLIQNLIPGVGPDIAKRSQFLSNLESKVKVSIEEKYKRLCFVTNHLVNFLDNNTLANIILTKHLVDLLSSLIQLGYAPLMKPKPNTQESSNEFVMTEEKYNKLIKEQEIYKNILNKVLSMFHQPMGIKSLLIIQSEKSPKWVKVACGKLLSSQLTQTNGVMNVIKGILDVGGLEESPSQNKMQSEKIQMISKILSNPPYSSYNDVEKYYANICQQIFEIFDMPMNESSQIFHLIASASVKSISEKSLTFSRRYIFDVIFEPLLKLTECSKNMDKLPSEEDIDKSIELLHFIFVLGNEPSIFLNRLEPVILVLVELHCSINFGISHLKHNVEQLLKRYLKCNSNSMSVETLRVFALNEEPSESQIKKFRKELHFVNGENGGVIVKSTDEAQENFYVADDERSIALVDLIQSDTQLSAEFFMSLLKDLTQFMVPKDEKKESKSNENKTVEQKLMDIDAELDRTMANLRKNLMLIRILGLISEDEKVQKAIIQDSERLLNLVTLIIDRAASSCTNKQPKNDDTEDDEIIGDEGSGILEAQSLNMALMLLSMKLTGDDEVKPNEWSLLKNTVKDLKTIETSYHDVQARSTARRLKQLILTHGIIMDHNDDIKESCDKLASKTKTLLEMTKKMKEMSTEENSASLSYKNALSDLTDPLLPVRGHGLIALTNLIQCKDEEAIKNISKVIEIFKENLEDTDSYIYLQSINGLAACADIKTSLIIEILTNEFANIFERNPEVSQSVEIQTKIGEVLVRITKNLGELTPAYQNNLINPFLNQINHTDELVRASSLSNLGEICKNLKFSLGNLVGEIFLCLDQSIQFDRSIEVRRAAVMVIAMLLQGLGMNSFRVLKDTLRDIWRTLINLAKTENDEALLIHTNNAIEEINKIMKQFLNPQPTLKKNIYVLDAPPDSGF